MSRVLAVSLLVGAAVVLSSLGMPLGPGANSSGVGPGSLPRDLLEEVAFPSAVAEIDRGQGPAASGPVSCREVGPLTAGCIVTSTSSASSPVGPVLGFQESTAGGALPPTTFLGDIVWNPADQDAVFFGGSNGHGVTNQTWLFESGNWVNVTDPAHAPPARYGAAMAYDGQAGVEAVVLYGGCDPGRACPLNDTWVFSAGSWSNLTATASVDPSRPIPGLSNATMTNWGGNATLLFGGCEDRSCTSESDQTWAFENSTSCWTAYAHPCWNNLSAASGTSPPAVSGAALADDPLVGPGPGTAVLYGGSLDSSHADSNQTWVLYGGAWTNITGTFVGGPYPNASRSFAQFFWDNATQRLYLYGGITRTGAICDQLWRTDIYGWSNDSALTLPNPARWGAAIAGVPNGASSRLHELLIGGNASGPATPQEWVFEPSLVAHSNLLPAPSDLSTTNRSVETNETVRFFSNATGGTVPTVTWTTGDGGGVAGGNGTYVYRTPGTYLAKLTVTDLYGVQNRSTVTTNGYGTPVVTSTFRVSVFLFSAGFAPPTAADQNVPVNFSAQPNGTAPYNFTWAFSDGTDSFGQNVTHVFASVGTAGVVLTVQDGTGSVVVVRATIPVHPPLTASATVSPRVFDVDTPTLLAATASNGTSPYTMTWTLPGGTTFVGARTSFRPTMSGSQNVTVVVTDAVGASWSAVLPLTVNPALSFTASSTSTSTTSGRTIQFSTTVTGGTSPYRYAWQFGDGSASSLSRPSHTFPSSGTFTVTVWVNDSGGGTYRQTLEVKIPRISGGLLWQLLALPLLDRLLIAVVIAAAVAIVGALVYRQRKNRPTAPRATNGPPYAKG